VKKYLALALLLTSILCSAQEITVAAAADLQFAFQDVAAHHAVLRRPKLRRPRKVDSMLYWLADFSDKFSFLNVFRYITFRTGGAMATALRRMHFSSAGDAAIAACEAAASSMANATLRMIVPRVVRCCGQSARCLGRRQNSLRQRAYGSSYSCPNPQSGPGRAGSLPIAGKSAGCRHYVRKRTDPLEGDTVTSASRD
jgi:hypothetical protein